MAERAPNTICKNAQCGKGADGGRKHYYTCRYCVASGNWRSVACSPECFEAYCRQVADARAKQIPVDTAPERTDLSPDEVHALVASEDMPAIMQESRDELSDVFDANPEMGLAEAVDLVNRHMDSQGKEKRSGKRGK